MDMRSRLKAAGLGLLICIVALPIAFFVTLFTFPFWRWFETVTGIESFGHSGPVEWCYWLVYASLVLCATFVWWLLRRAAQQFIKQKLLALNDCKRPKAVIAMRDYINSQGGFSFIRSKIE